MAEKMKGHRARFLKNDDLPLWRDLAVKKKLPFFYAPPVAHPLITHKTLRSRDAQCYTEE